MRTSGQKEKKKVLKESALLEMDGNRVYQELRKFFSTSIPYLIRLRFFRAFRVCCYAAPALVFLTGHRVEVCLIESNPSP